MGLKVKGPDLETIERVALDIEQLLKKVPSVEASAVIADRIVGKPYLESISTVMPSNVMVCTSALCRM